MLIFFRLSVCLSVCLFVRLGVYKDITNRDATEQLLRTLEVRFSDRKIIITIDNWQLTILIRYKIGFLDDILRVELHLPYSYIYPDWLFKSLQTLEVLKLHWHFLANSYFTDLKMFSKNHHLIYRSIISLLILSKRIEIVSVSFKIIFSSAKI